MFLGSTHQIKERKHSSFCRCWNWQRAVFLTIVITFSSSLFACRVNMNYEYEDTDINALLLLRVQEEGLDLNRIILMLPVDNMGDQIVEQLREEGVRYRERVLAQEIMPAERTILVPINLNNVHWVGLVVRLNEQNQVLRIQYIDPLGSFTLEDSIPPEIRRDLREVYGRNTYIENLLLLRQTDGTACGALTIENLIRAAQNNLNTRVVHEESTRQIRGHHIDLLEQFRSDLRFNFRQNNNMSEWGKKKIITLSYNTHFRDMLFHKFLSGRMIFLYGTSTAGKSSIVDYIKSEARLNDVDLVFTGSDAIRLAHMTYAFSRYSPKNIKFLQRYFSIDKIIKGIYYPDWIFELMQKELIDSKYTALKKEEVEKIKRIFEEFHVNREKIFFLERDLPERPAFCFRAFSSALNLGKTIIVDTVRMDEFFQAMAVRLLHCKVDVVIIYCSLEKLKKHLYLRNKEASQSSSLFINSRIAIFPFMQYARIYEPTIFPIQSIDMISLLDTEIPKELSDICQYIFEQGGDKWDNLYREDQWEEIMAFMQKRFALSSNREECYISPSCDYHFWVNTGEESAEICGEKILKKLKILK